MTSTLALDNAALGRKVRAALRSFATTTRLDGPARDRQALIMLNSHYPKAVTVFPEQALLAVLREPGDGCSWDAYRDLAADNGEPTPKPSAGLEPLLGRPCDRWCKPAFEAARVARREGAMLTAAAQGGPAPTGVLWPAGHEPAAVVASARAAARRAASNPPPSYYRRGRP